MSTAKMIFHGSDIEKICEVYQLKPEEIVKFGANVTGAFRACKGTTCRTAGYPVFLSRQRLYFTSQHNFRIL